ncbi:MAG: hypothetical protein QW667_03225 [Candidatus Bathyarchaeia archaeon]
MYELTLIFLLALLFLIVYFVGMRQNRKVAVQYAKAVKEYMSPKSNFVGFRPYSRGGFRALCKMKDEEAFEHVEMAVSLVDRENLMHYPLSLLTKDCDRIACWGFLKNPISVDLEILTKVDEKIHRKMTSERNLKNVTIENASYHPFFIVYASNKNLAHNFLSNRKLEKFLLEAKDSIRRLSLDSKNSRVYLIGDLRKPTSLKNLLDIFMCSADQSRKIQKTLVDVQN